MPDDDAHDRAARAAQVLRLAGLPEEDMDNRAVGGFVLDVRGNEVTLVWFESESLRRDMFERFDEGDFQHPLIHHAGLVGVVMIDAMVKILQSAGIPAQLCDDLEVGAAKL